MFDALATWLIYDLAGLQGTPFGAAAHFFVMDVTKILVLLTLVIYLMGLLRALLKPEKVREFIRNRGNLQSRFMAVGLGAVTPFCSCSSIPLFIGFVEAGIPLGVTLSFLIASPMINEVAVVVLASVIGWKFTVLYVLTGLTVALIGGFVLERFKPERWVEDYVWKIHMGQVAQVEEDKSLRARHEYALGQVQRNRRAYLEIHLHRRGGGFLHPRLRAGRAGRQRGGRWRAAVGHRRGADRRAAVFRRGRHHPHRRSTARQGCTDRHGAGLHDGSHRTVAAGNDHPEKSGESAAAGAVRRLSDYRFRHRRHAVQPIERFYMSTDLHPSIVALVSLAANIAANHPKQGLCQVDKLKLYGVAQEQIDAVVEIARHIRDESGDIAGHQL